VRSILFAFCFLPFLLLAQPGDPVRIADEKPVLKSCLKVLDIVQREQCSNQGILTFIYQNVVYPDTALQQEIEGMVVVEAIIGKTGRVIGAKLVKDIGGGCGDAVIDVLRELEAVDNLWLPAVVDEIPVDYVLTIPVKFNIPEPAPPPPPYQVFGMDTIYHEYSTLPMYGDAENAIETLLKENLKYPTAYKDSCLAGTMDAQVVIGTSGQLQIVEIMDYENLGFDFQFEFIQILNSTSGKWMPGTYEEKPVHVIHNIPAIFLPAGNGCAELAENFKSANDKALIGNELYQTGNLEAALESWGAAITLFPENGAFRFMRGQALLENNLDPVQCCEDLTIAQRNIKLPPLLAGTLPIICKQAQKEMAPAEEVENGEEKEKQ